VVINLDGWVSINRKLVEHWTWKDRPFSKGQAWIDLILMANHKDNKFPLGDEIIIVERGSLVTSELKLMERWGWSKSKLRYFLNSLEIDSMIVKKTDRKKTTITIVNYGVYQEMETTERPKKDHKKTDDRPIKDTNNNVNNVNNILPKGNIKEYVADQPLNQAILDFIEYRKKKAPMTPKAVDLMIKKLNELSPVTSVQIAILNQSILNGWKGVFELKQDKRQDQPKSSNNRFNQFPQREYSQDKYDAIEKAVMNRREE
jgi:hypothetical protein